MAANFLSAARQGAAAFGDAGVFVEKYVEVRRGGGGREGGREGPAPSREQSVQQVVKAAAAGAAGPWAAAPAAAAPATPQSAMRHHFALQTVTLPPMCPPRLPCAPPPPASHAPPPPPPAARTAHRAATARAGWLPSRSASAPSSAGTKRCWRRRPPPLSPPRCGASCRPRRCGWAGGKVPLRGYGGVHCGRRHRQVLLPRSQHAPAGGPGGGGGWRVAVVAGGLSGGEGVASQAVKGSAANVHDGGKRPALTLSPSRLHWGQLFHHQAEP